MKSKKPFRFLLALAVATTAATLHVRAEIFEQILVKVNGEIFTKSDLENRQVAVLRQSGQQIDPKTISNQQLRKALDDITPKLMVDVVDEILMVQRGKELGYSLGDEQFKSIVDSIRRRTS